MRDDGDDAIVAVMSTPAPVAPEPARARLPWHVVYYLLAAFNIVTVCSSLYLNYRVTDLYVQAVASNQEWGQLMADYLALEHLAAEANAAGNDVFESRDPMAEAKRSRAARTAFAERMAALRKDLAVSAPAASVGSLLAGLEDIDGAMRKMDDEAEAIFAQFGRQGGAAERHMVAMDRAYAELLNAFREQRDRFGLARAPRPVHTPGPEVASPGLNLPRWERFQRQTSLAASVQRDEWVIAGLIALMLTGAVLYGRRLERQMAEAAAERTRYIDALSEARATLEQRVIERTEELRRSEEERRREEKMAAMGSLVAGVAHEVRNPLFGISGTIETLGVRLGPHPDLDKYFAVLKRDVGRLRVLMQDLLDYGKPPRLVLAPTPLETIVAEAVRACEPLPEGLGVETMLAPDLPPVVVDRRRLEQVLENLIRNAVQHSPAAGRVVVEAGRSRAGLDERGAVWLSVRDVGPGFRAEDLPRLFEPFFTKREGGTGLGLSIAQRIVEQHGGRIVAENHAAGGAVVRLTLPLDAAVGTPA